VKGEIEGSIAGLDVDKLYLSDPEKTKALIRQLLSIIEVQAQTIKELREEIQQHRDEIAHLKGEKGKPKILPNVPDISRDAGNHLADKPKTWKKRSKGTRIKIDRVERLYVDKSKLPADAIGKGFRSVVKQDIKFETNNVEYLLERYYSPSLKKIFEAELPKDLQGTEFGSTLKSLIFSLHYVGRVPENRIQQILESIGTIISEGTISNILTQEKCEAFTSEKEAIFETGMQNASYFQIDDTGARHAGKNHYLEVVCNDQFSSFFILEGKGKDELRPVFGLKEGEQVDKPMVSDAAQQFCFLSPKQGLCWIHEIRHYRKLTPILDRHRALLSNFIDWLWDYYELLKEYREHPDYGLRIHIEWLFDSIFLPATHYVMLDETIASTRKRKDRLLRMLDYPELPLHNNASEIALREGVIKRKISYGTRSEAGKVAWENQLTILDTCRKQKVSFFEYIRDIISESFSMPRLYQLLVPGNRSTAY
jgi:hypothetical protein